MSDIWNDAHIQRLRELWPTPMSAAQIALDLGCSITRNAVIGKAMRLKLPPRKLSASSARLPQPVQRAESRFNPPANRAAALKKRPEPLPRRAQSNSIVERVAIAKAEPGLPEHLEEPAVGAGMQLLDLTNSSCRWPFGHPGTDRFYFCGAEGADMNGKRPYCPFHTRKAKGVAVRTAKEFENGVLHAAGIKRRSTTGAQHG